MHISAFMPESIISILRQSWIRTHSGWVVVNQKAAQVKEIVNHQKVICAKTWWHIEALGTLRSHRTSLHQHNSWCLKALDTLYMCQCLFKIHFMKWNKHSSLNAWTTFCPRVSRLGSCLMVRGSKQLNCLVLATINFTKSLLDNFFQKLFILVNLF